MRIVGHCTFMQCKWPWQILDSSVIYIHINGEEMNLRFEGTSLSRVQIWELRGRWNLIDLEQWIRRRIKLRDISTTDSNWPELNMRNMRYDADRSGYKLGLICWQNYRSVLFRPKVYRCWTCTTDGSVEIIYRFAWEPSLWELVAT